MEEVKQGEKWYAQRPGAITLFECRVTDITTKTVEIVAIGVVDGRPERYTKMGLLFVEKIEDTELKAPPE